MENAATFVDYLARLAVHERLRADDLATEGFANRLVAETDAEYRNFTRHFADKLNADAGFAGCAGTGRDDYLCGAQRFDVANFHLIVAADFDPFTQLSH